MSAIGGAESSGIGAEPRVVVLTRAGCHLCDDAVAAVEAVCADTGDSCLSDAQIAAVRTMNAPARFAFPLARGNKEYPGYNVWGADLGITSASPVEPTWMV